jgi:hypothetical protein
VTITSEPTPTPTGILFLDFNIVLLGIYETQMHKYAAAVKNKKNN